MKTIILTSVLLVTLATAGTLTYAANTDTGANVLKKKFNDMHLTESDESHFERGNDTEARGGMRGFNMMRSENMRTGPMTKLTDAEKTQLTKMTDAEKKVFFEAKIASTKSLRDARENVIDKLINGETLSDTEKATLAIIKTERAAQKTERLAREAQMTEIKPIMEKVGAGTTLTTEEKAKLDAFKATMPQGGKGGKDGKKGRMMR